MYPRGRKAGITMIVLMIAEVAWPWLTSLVLATLALGAAFGILGTVAFWRLFLRHDADFVRFVRHFF